MRGALPLLLCALAAACAPSAGYRPVVDLDSVDRVRFEVDLRDCTSVAERDRYGPLLVGLLQGAAVGTALGSVGGWLAYGNIGLAQSYGAISGAVAGTAVGATQSGERPDAKQIVDQCLRNNGYDVAS